MVKKLILIVISVLLCLSFVVPASAYTYQYVSDYTGKLSYSELDELEAYAQKLESSYGVCVIFCMVNSIYNESAAEYASQIYNENTDNENGIILLYNDAEQICTFFVSGNADTYFNADSIEEMRNSFDANESYYGGAYDYYDLAKGCLENSSYGVSYNTDTETVGAADSDSSSEEKGLPIIWLPVSIAIGMAAGALIINSIASKNKSVRMQKNATVYTRPGSMIITGSADNFLYSNTDRTEKAKENKN